MIPLKVTAKTSITDFIDAYWLNDQDRVTEERAKIHYRNRTRWQNVMPAVAKALPTLWEVSFGPGWREAQGHFVHFEVATLKKVYDAVMDGTGEGVEYVITEVFPEEIAHITRPMLKTMWKKYTV